MIKRVDSLKAGQRVRHCGVTFTVAHPARFLAEDKQGRGYLVLEHTPDTETKRPTDHAEIVTVYRGEGWITVDE